MKLFSGIPSIINSQSENVYMEAVTNLVNVAQGCKEMFLQNFISQNDLLLYFHYSEHSLHKLL